MGYPGDRGRVRDRPYGLLARRGHLPGVHPGPGLFRSGPRWRGDVRPPGEMASRLGRLASGESGARTSAAVPKGARPPDLARPPRLGWTEGRGCPTLIDTP